VGGDGGREQRRQPRALLLGQGRHALGDLAGTRTHRRRRPNPTTMSATPTTATVVAVVAVVATLTAVVVAVIAVVAADAGGLVGGRQPGEHGRRRAAHAALHTRQVRPRDARALRGSVQRQPTRDPRPPKVT
jgi:hypothetical protein